MRSGGPVNAHRGASGTGHACRAANAQQSLPYGPALAIAIKGFRVTATRSRATHSLDSPSCSVLRGNQCHGPVVDTRDAVSVDHR